MYIFKWHSQQSSHPHSKSPVANLGIIIRPLQNNAQISPAIWTTTANYKQLLDEVFVISRIIKVEVRVISRSRRLRLITLTETLIIPDITKTESNNCFIILCLQVISQFLAGSMKWIEKPFLLRCLRTWHCCPCTWHCSWKSCNARATYRLFTYL